MDARLLHTLKNKNWPTNLYSRKKKVGLLLFSPQKGTQSKLVKININAFHLLTVTAVPRQAPLPCLFFLRLVKVPIGSKLSIRIYTGWHPGALQFDIPPGFTSGILPVILE